MRKTVTEECGNQKRLYEYTKGETGDLVRIRTNAQAQHRGIWDRFTDGCWSFFRLAFLPEGYPDSVSPDYAAYQRWDTAQALCSSVTGTLATRAVLRGVGVGQSSANATSATLQWIFRDGTGMIGRIGFASLQGSNLDSNAKTWRLGADVTNDLAILTDILIGVFPPSWFLFCACLASVLRAITGVAGGATRASLTQHFAVRSNMADVSAKDGSQETAVNLMGMILGMLVTWMVPDETSLLTWVVFSIFTFLHLWTNYRGVRVLVLNVLNRQRTDMLIREFRKSPVGNLSTPTDISKQEQVLFYWSKPAAKVTIGGSLTSASSHNVLASLQVNKETHKFLCCGDSGVVLLLKGAENTDVLLGYFQAFLMLEEGMDLASAQAAVENSGSAFLAMLTKAGWNLDRVALNQLDWRVSV